MIAFVDGDRGGDLNIRELLSVADIDFVTKAPELKSHLVDMEGYAIAKVGKMFNCPTTIIKYVTDMADEDAADHWAENQAAGAELLLDFPTEDYGTLTDANTSVFGETLLVTYDCKIDPITPNGYFLTKDLGYLT